MVNIGFVIWIIMVGSTFFAIIEIKELIQMHVLWPEKCQAYFQVSKYFFLSLNISCIFFWILIIFKTALGIGYNYKYVMIRVIMPTSLCGIKNVETLLVYQLQIYKRKWLR